MIYIKSLVASLIVLISLASSSYAGFYVIPVGNGTCDCNDGCTGTSVGSKAFVLDISSSRYLFPGQIYATTTGHLVEITGYIGSCNYLEGASFLVAPATLPEPRDNYGVKGPFYYLNGGSVVYAKYL